MEHVNIRAAGEADLDAIVELQARSIMTLGIQAYDLETLKAWARMGRQIRHNLLESGTFFVAEVNGAILGVAGWTADSRELDSAWPRYVFVLPEAAGQGIGRRLMAAIERSAIAASRPRLQLWSSLNAVRFYQAIGFQKVRSVSWPVGGGIEMEHLLMEKG